MELVNNEWEQKLSLDRSIESCHHEEECKFLDKDETIREGMLPCSQQDSQDSNNTTVVNIGSVETLGSISGQNNKNKIESIKDETKANMEVSSGSVQRENSEEFRRDVNINSQFNSPLILLTSLVLVIAVLLYIILSQQKIFGF